ncbi:MAG: flagellar basal-body rod protein FlgC [Phycisphaerae bacterium]|jgi:flagellar basal-body rod protein FlgC|nr:MAG: flagellar basal body rod protein FlgC [Planctomycetia bacterium]RIK66154.1 MAG: flagellar basal body rod protein FlgC [Planctomycetota bacterium]GJQ25644.1 MAG: flagellar basal-body rod protein FlgC [Phycisphaerae bacterium]
MFGALDISTSGLAAQRTWLDTISANIANAQTTRRADGGDGPYLRQVALFAPGDGRGGAGVHVEKIVEDHSGKPREVKDPGHPDADARGIVRYPNVDLATEMVNAMVAVRAYEANVTAAEATKSIVASTLRLLA